jgi:hypothetical protein
MNETTKTKKMENDVKSLVIGFPFSFVFLKTPDDFGGVLCLAY